MNVKCCCLSKYRYFFVVDPAKLLKEDQNKPAEEVKAEGCERKAGLYLKLLSSAFTAASNHQAEQKPKKIKIKMNKSD